MSLGDKFEVISVLDPAIETARMTPARMVEYSRTRDIAIVRPFIKEGAAPTIYHMREIPRSLMRSYVCAFDMSDTEKATRAFLAGLVRITNLHQSDGTVIPSFDPPRETNRDIVDERALERVWPEESEEVGRVVFQHSFLHPRMQQPFLLQPTCHALLTERPFLTADANPNSQPSSSDAVSPAANPPPAPTDLAPVSTGAPFVSLTDATAPETQIQVAVG